MQSDYFSNEILRDHYNLLLQTPFLCSWHFEKLAKTLHIHLCVQGNYSPLEKLEFLFVPTNEIRFLNSHKILFENVSEILLLRYRLEIFVMIRLNWVDTSSLNVSRFSLQKTLPIHLQSM